MKKILITGGTGFAASHLVEALLAQGETEIHLTAYRDRGSYVKSLVKPTHIHELNLTDFQATRELFEQIQPEQIYHLASIAAVGDSFEKTQFVMEMNLNLQLSLLEAMTAITPTARLLHVSTALVYQASRDTINEQAPFGPENPYALSKLTQDLLCESYDKEQHLDIVRVRPFNHIGERQSLGFVVADWANGIAQIEKGTQSTLSVGNLESIRDFSDVKDIVQGYILLMNQGKSGEVYNLGSGKGVKIKEILDQLIQQAHCPIPVVTDQGKIRPVDLPYLVCDNEKISQLGWRPQHQLTETLRRILAYWRTTV